MTLLASMKVKEIAKQLPASVRLFEEYGIDYCCGGGKSLAEACAAAKQPIDEVLEKLEKLNNIVADSDLTLWEREPLSDLVHHIVEVHHGFVRREIPRLKLLIEKVGSRHADSHPELTSLNLNFGFIAEELMNHMLKEEQVLFPYIERLQASKETATAPPPAVFGSVARPVECMMREHDLAASMLQEIRELTRDYLPPQGACPTYRAMLNGLHEFERDLHRHVHLENNILFPKAIELETVACALA
jgi:regulator of cell morphogenesis and NO signaling